VRQLCTAPPSPIALAGTSLYPSALFLTEEPRMSSPLQLLFSFVWFIILAHVIMSWLINFQVLNMRQPLVAQLWDGLNRLLEPIYRVIRRFLPATGGLDFAPIAAIFILYTLEYLLRRYTGLM
jgi:YggT family protein